MNAAELKRLGTESVKSMQLDNDKQHCISDPLQDSEVLLRAMVENLLGRAAFVVDSDLRYRLAEGEALSTAGFKPEDLVGKTIFEVLPPDLAASYEGLYRKGLAGEPFEHDHNAHDRFYISRGTPLRSANGSVYAADFAFGQSDWYGFDPLAQTPPTERSRTALSGFACPPSG
ncbi:PAS domain-containing protein [Leptolyngbya sp. FACHB-541]|nr:PAS domain-containing protein [Leptolyngbya sp. FACHB-541]